MYEKSIPLWGIITLFLSLIVSFGSILYANNSRISEKEMDTFRLTTKELDIKYQGIDKRTTIVETKMDSILEGIRDINKKLDEHSKEIK